MHFLNKLFYYVTLNIKALNVNDEQSLCDEENVILLASFGFWTAFGASEPTLCAFYQQVL